MINIDYNDNDGDEAFVIARNRTGSSGGTELFNIAIDNNVGISSSTPWGLLSVNANALSAGTPQFVVGSSTVTDFLIANSGVVALGTTTISAPGYGSGQLLIDGTRSSTADDLILFDPGTGNGNWAVGPNSGTGKGFGFYNLNGGITALKIAPSGNVGIGTSTPLTKLNVYGSTTIQTWQNVPTAFRILNAATTSVFTVDTVNGSTSIAGLLNVAGAGTSTINQNLWVQGTLQVGTGSLWLSNDWLTSNGTFTIANKNATSNNIILDPGRHVGIGTTTPFGVLSIHATSSVPSFVIGSSTATSFIVDANGRVGIGTSSPASPGIFSVGADGSSLSAYFQGVVSIGAVPNTTYPWLSVAPRNNSRANLGLISTGGAGGSIDFGDNGSFSSQIIHNGTLSDALEFRTGGIDNSSFARILIRSTGEVGIGTTTPLTPLSVYGSTTIQTWQNVPTAFRILNAATSSVFTVDTVSASTTIAGVLNVGNGTSTFNGGITTDVLATRSTSASSTFANGITLANGCFAIGATCVAGVSTVSGAGTQNFVAKYTTTGSTIGNSQIFDNGLFVGIGTSTPLTTASRSLAIYGSTTIQTWQNVPTAFQILNAATSTVFVVNTVNSTVGIGTSTPANWLNEELVIQNTPGSSDTMIAFAHGLTAYRIGIASDGPNGNFELRSAFDDSILSVASTTLYVGIASTSPWGLLSVNANALAVGTPQFVVGSSTATNFIVANNGSVGIGLANMVNTQDKFEISFNQGADDEQTLQFWSNGGTQLSVGHRANSGTTPIFSSAGNVAVAIDTNNNGTDLFQVVANDAAIDGGDAVELFRVQEGGNSYFTSSAGNVGIGTTSPNWNLQVAGTRPFLTLSDTAGGTNLKHWYLSSQGGNLYIGTTTDAYATTTGDYQAFTILNSGKVNIGHEIGVDANATMEVQGAAQAFSTAQGLVSLYSKDAFAQDKGASIILGGLYNATGRRAFAGIGGFKENATSDNFAGYFAIATRLGGGALEEKLRVTSTGNVGIGTTTPFGVLSVHATSSVPSFVIGSSTATSFIVDASGRVAIGTSSATYVNMPAMLTVVGEVGQTSGSTTIRIMNTINSGNANSAIEFWEATGKAAFLLGYDGSRNALDIASPLSGTHLMTINRTGNVGIGTTTPLFLFSVYGSSPTGIIAASNSGGFSRLTLDTPTRNWRIINDGTNSDKFTIYDGTAAATRMIIDTSGNVGIATTSPWRTLSVVGTMAINGLTQGAAALHDICINSVTFDVVQN
ncbi:MAG: hypothetical protein Q7J73_08075, partial [Dehalococcoidales bacterium]|nr:hypothetical protein [Dehalococcoidales bacterium]